MDAKFTLIIVEKKMIAWGQILILTYTENFLGLVQ